MDKSELASLPSHIESVAIDGADEMAEISKVHVSGTVKLTAERVVYIPEPTADPRGRDTCSAYSVDMCLMRHRSVEPPALARSPSCGNYFHL
jgi:hypothetical protein